MRLNVSAASIRRPIPALVLFLVLVALGMTSLQRLPVTRLPSVDLPIVSVVVPQFGAAPAEIEAQVTKPVETAVASIAGVRHVSSSITDGLSSTLIEFRLETDPATAVNDVKDALGRLRADLPQTVQEPIVQRIEIAGLPIVTFGVVAPSRTAEEISSFVDDTVKRALLGVAGVGTVERIGGFDREISVTLDPVRLAEAGLTVPGVNQQLRAATADMAGGRAPASGRDTVIRTLAGVHTVEALASTPIAMPNGSTLRLDDLGTVRDTVAEPRTFAMFDGEPIVAFAVSRARGASDVDVAREVAARVAALAAAHPGVSFRLVDNPVEYTIGNYHATVSTLLEGAALAVIVVFIFLKDWRATLIAAIALPLSILPTFWAMETLGFSLNLVSLLAITLSTGILVDDAIVEIENIIRHMRTGKSAYDAALEAADEIGLAVIAITATIIAIFVPSSFMGGIAGQFFKQFGVTIAVAVFVSLLVARLITPMLAAYFLRDSSAAHAHDEADGRILRAYTGLVAWSVRHRIVTVVLGLAVFAGSIASALLLPTTLLPPEDTSRSLVVLELPPGVGLDGTRATADAVTRRLKAIPEVRSVLVQGGRVPIGAPEARRATLIVDYASRAERKRPQRELERVIADELAQVPDIRFYFLDANGLRPVTVIVTGEDGAGVSAAAADLAAQMRRLPQLSNVISTASLAQPEIRVLPRPEAAALGLPSAALAEALRVTTLGDVGPNLPRVDMGGRLLPVRVRLDPAFLEDRLFLEALQVAGPQGQPVPLGAVAEVQLGQGQASIERYDRARSITIEADLAGGVALGEAMSATLALPAARQPPPGISVREAGDAETMTELFDGFAIAMQAGLLLVYGVLVILFASFLQPIVILFSLPLSIGGAMLGLLAAGQPISMPVSIGILMLLGIVTKNAILLVDFALEAEAQGLSRERAIVDAGRKRARPIIMTTVAMVAGMVPSALAIGAGGEARAPIAIAVIGGLITSTLLSLVFVPAVFMLMGDLGRALRPLAGLVTGRRGRPLREDERRGEVG
ncbi:efflux RND transporter permease subunit [Salinarimonas soli]|uniref:Efflux RND transporter permease subunit n=1 Tax=Salinarimonas soli TaxID=1638099 RepID=A0A5B2VA15_9HYPH|nr:efflux RND transporter permease subunit [Salinarimonas soli]KAA2235646.1 efflux RND transporter permease subunit [Salinarimonas soli]